jgi:inositol-phosphate phosphatase / L-galactose 1-phosphate phosphatase / histidinol-phosphatase
LSIPSDDGGAFLKDALTLAQSMADAAAAVVMPYYKSRIPIDTKADTSPVTAADREAEAVMRAQITATFADHGIFGEEHGQERIDAKYVWVLDPIDGTKSFVTGKPLFGTLIALLEDGVPILGIMDNPALKERWVGCRGSATALNGEAVAGARRCESLGDAWLYTTTPEMFEGAEDVAFQRLAGSVCNSVYGADCYAYGLVADGHVDIVCEANMQPYDYCALVPIVQGAGGVMSNWRGEPLGLNSGGTVLAAGDSAAHQAALALLSV